LTGKDAVVLADFTKTTKDAVFDDKLKTALSVSLRQSRFLNVFSDNRVAATLEMMDRPADTTLTSQKKFEGRVHVVIEGVLIGVTKPK
jgi:hypothetical protein